MHEDEIEKTLEYLKSLLIPTLTEALPSESFCDATNCGMLYTHIIYADEKRNKIVKVMADLGKSGTCPKAHLSSMCEHITGAYLYMSKEDRYKVIIMAAGHKCGLGVTCFDVIHRRLIAIDSRIGG